MLRHGDVKFSRFYPWAVKPRRQSELLNAWLQQQPYREALPQLSGFDAALRRYLD